MAQAVPIIIAVVAAATSAYAAVKQGQSAQAAADFNAATSNQNAELARQQGIAARDAADRQNRQRLGSMKSEMGASGLESDSGSALDTLMSSASQMKLDEANVGYNAQVRALGYQNQAAGDTFEGQSAASNSYWKASGDLLSGASNVAGKVK
jgi:hypothetical protein